MALVGNSWVSELSELVFTKVWESQADGDWDGLSSEIAGSPDSADVDARILVGESILVILFEFLKLLPGSLLSVTAWHFCWEEWVSQLSIAGSKMI